MSDGLELVAFDTGDFVALSAVGRALSAEGIEVFWEPNDPLEAPLTSVYGARPTFKVLVQSADVPRAHEVLGEDSPVGVRYVWAPETFADDGTPRLTDEEPAGDEGPPPEDAPFWDENGEPSGETETRDELLEWAYYRAPWELDELVVDDPAALEAAEAAVRGEAPTPSFGRDHAAGNPPAVWDAGWRALVGWPESEIARHRTVAHLGLGSNLSDRMAQLAEAVAALDELPETDVMGVSHAYESEPWGGIEQPAYANAVAVVSTALRADQLLMSIAEIEQSLGRERGGERFGPRTIDIDILLFGDEEWQRSDLVIPHPRMLEREFVVAPLLEIDPFVTMPDGSAISPGRAREGRITGTLGVLTGYERLTRATAGERPEPLEFVTEFEPADAPESVAREGWVAIEESLQGMMMGYQGAMTLQIHLGVLADAGIPAVLDPPPIFGSPGVPHYAAMMPIRLMVPFPYEQQARRALLQAQSQARDLDGLAGADGRD
ncbi:MAG: 2-amino-4-hydroxy-6-hydroxymethyldihydropteridine diphosphokinase [Coriobacteriia bacterium]